MIKEEDVQTAQDFLTKSDGYFAEDDVLQGSEEALGGGCALCDGNGARARLGIRKSLRPSTSGT